MESIFRKAIYLDTVVWFYKRGYISKTRRWIKEKAYFKLTNANKRIPRKYKKYLRSKI